eukprot:3021186-Pyramimonas_sp.AAC.1
MSGGANYRASRPRGNPAPINRESTLRSRWPYSGQSRKARRTSRALRAGMPRAPHVPGISENAPQTRPRLCPPQTETPALVQRLPGN